MRSQRPNTVDRQSNVYSDENSFRSRIVELIRDSRDPETAIEELSTHYRIQRPRLRIGLPKGEKKALGCYVQRDKTIYISNYDYLYDPYVVIHEFYHHLRNVTGKHRGTERHAKEFALAFLRSVT
jgi:hypothetical protein